MAVALTGIFASFTSPWFPFLLCSVHGNRRRMKENPPPPLSPPPLHLYGVSSFLGENQYAWPVGPRARALSPTYFWATGRKRDIPICFSVFVSVYRERIRKQKQKTSYKTTKIGAKVYDARIFWQIQPYADVVFSVNEQQEHSQSVGCAMSIGVVAGSERWTK